MTELAELESIETKTFSRSFHEDARTAVIDVSGIAKSITQRSGPPMHC